MQTKADPPAQLLSDHMVTPFIHAYFEFNQLKQLYRQGWLSKGMSRERCETVAEHTFSMAVLAMLLADAYFPQLDALRVLRLVLLHDIGEVHAGDITPADQVDANEKHRLERDSVQQVMTGIPNAAQYLALWQEYEDGSTAEARFVKQIDRLEMGLQAGVYQLQGIVDGSEFIQSADYALSSPQLRGILQELVMLLDGI
jgi:putative hydrolases of HD superfamily